MLIDLTHVICEQMPVYPGTLGPKLSPAATLERDSFQETLLTLYSHTGTHMDAPAHMLQGRRTLDQLDISRFSGTAAVIDCRGAARITMDRIEPVRTLADHVDFLLFWTGWDRHWKQPAYFDDFPVMDEAVARYCCQSRKAGVGVDAISVDASDSQRFPNHKILLESDLVIVENLRGLEQLHGSHCRFFALPLLYENADGAPVRAMAELR